MTEQNAAGRLMSIFQPIANRSRSMNAWSLGIACAAGEAFLLYSILIAHTLRPVTALLIGQDSGRQSTAHRYQETFNWDGLIPTMLGSLLIIAAVWSALHLTARSLPKSSLPQLQMDDGPWLRRAGKPQRTGGSDSSLG